MTPKQISLVQKTWQLVLPIAPQAAEIFYNTLFELDPSVKALFPNDVTEQGERLMSMLDTAVKLLNEPEKLIPALQKLGERHIGYNVEASHYDTVGVALLKTLEVGLGDAFTAPVKKAWTAVYMTLAKTMIDAADTINQDLNTTSKGSNMNAIIQGNDLTEQFKGALDQSATAIMMIDRDFIITYANESTMKLLKKNEKVFAENWPGFKADYDEIIGGCIDSFHTNPAHQRAMLADESNLPYQTDIQIKHLTFELNVSAIKDNTGEYIGNSLEWQDVTEIREQASRAIQLQGSIDQSATAMMMIDRDFIITYANKATMALLKKNETVFADNFPGFKADADEVLGSCIDIFHKNPSHQRAMLADESNLPYKTDIQIKHLTFELNVSAINDGDGQYIGNSLEWQDVTIAREQASRAVQLQGSIDQSATAMMMIDRDFIITYVNEATMVLLKTNERTFADNFPGFKANTDDVLGSCIDIFHKNPAHQRAMLADESNLPYQTDIQIKHLSFQLNVSAIKDGEGQYIGNSLEWQDVTAAREKSIEVGRLSSAMEGMSTNVMMADTLGNIVYANPAVKTMLRRREAQLRTGLPNFSVDSMVGTNFDAFHRNPAHQQNLLGNPDNLPYTTEITVVGLTFQLIAIALKDEEGNHVGTGVQWLDLTEQKDAEGQVGKLISDAINGQLESRIDSAQYEGFMKGLADNINSLMDAVVAPINEAITVAQALSDGDLTQTMDGEYSGEFLALSNAMNGSIENLSNMVDEIRSASTNVFDSAREIAEGNNELSHRTESQASSLEETASAMEELTSTVQQNAENASQASVLAGTVMTKASDGGGVVKNAIMAMSDINKSSKKIADIISVIDEIAFQTNLLALNAAVEAARAGEQGRGFAVVAAEVRNLAQRSAGAAKEIKGLINDSVEAVGQGTTLVDETGKTFTELVSSIEEVSKMINDIDSAGKEQSAGIGEVSAAVSQMDEMTQQNAALVEEASASSKSMEEQAQLLLDQVDFFNNGEEEEPVLQRAPKRNQSPKRAGNTSIKAKTNTQSRAKPSRAKTNSDDEWEEF